MPRLFIEGQRYEAISSTSLQEREYQALILQHADVLFPGLLAVPFDKTVYHEGIGHGADLAVIDPSYSRWWVVEVELSHHSLERHVLPQVETLAQAPYGDAEAEWLAERNRELDELGLKRMMLGAQPRVLVVVNAFRPEWMIYLRPYAEMMVVELFRSERDRYIIRQDGVNLVVPQGEVTRCHVHPAMPRMLVVESPAPLLARVEDSVEIEYGGVLTEWNVIRQADLVWLSPRRGSVFPQASHLSLVELPGDRLGLVPIDPPRRNVPRFGTA